jgi:phosphoinositide-3-kinase regulatory subunit 4
MDVFSLGCTIAELFLEGNSLFSLSQLLKYRIGEFDPGSEIEKIKDENIRVSILLIPVESRNAYDTT